MIYKHTEYKLSDWLWMYDPFFGPNLVDNNGMHVRIPASLRILTPLDFTIEE